tara:strand:- start:2258 stop:3388 length:1131 start_codon:yes stop_codon:yes gene_type:complete
MLRKSLAKYFITASIFSLNICLHDFSKAQSLNQDINYTSQNTFTEKKIIKPDYILGPGDQLKIEFLGLESFSRVYIIDNEGFIDLPELNLLKAGNKTIFELHKILLEKYNEFIYKPQIKIRIQRERPLTVTLRGEVNNSGLHVFNPEFFQTDTDLSDSSSGINNTFKNPKFQNSYTIRPKLFDLIKRGKGLTTNADLTKIIIVRNNSISGGGGKVKKVINLFNLLDKGDQDVNIELRDGDDVFVSRSENILLDQLSAFNNSNLTPSEITVFINGNIIKPGKIKLPQGISLFEAISATGKKSLSGKIEFIRFKKRGKTEKRIIDFKEESIKGSIENPLLLSGDIIYVRKNILGQTTQAIKEYSTPIISSYGLYKLFD